MSVKTLYMNDRINSAKRPLYAAVFLMEITYGLFLIVAAIRAAQAVESPLLLGLLSPVHLTTRVCGNYFFGGLSDRLGRKRLILASCLIELAALLLLFRPGFTATILAYFVCGLGNSIFWPSIESWIGQESRGESLLRHLGVFGMTFTAGLGVGSLAGGAFQRLAPPIALGFACLALGGVTALLVATKDATAPERGSGPSRADRRSVDGAEETAVVRPGLAAAYLAAGRLANFATWMTVGNLRFLFPKLCLQMGLPATLVGTVNGFFYLSWFLMFFLLTRFRRWTYRAAPLFALQAVGAAAALFLGLAPARGTFYLAFGCFGLNAGMTYFSSMFYGQNGAADKGRKSGLHEMVLSLGTLAGPLLGGLVAEFTGLRGAFLLAAGVIIIAAGIEMRILTRAWAAGNESRGVPVGSQG